MPLLPFVKNVTAKSSMLSVRLNIKPLIIPGHSSGMSTFRNACQGVAPRSNAASYRFGFILLKRGITLSTTYGVQKTTCAMITVTNPRDMPSETKRRNKEMPVIISGLIIGIEFKNRRVLRWRCLRLNIPMAASVPRMVDRMAATKAMEMV